MILSQKEVQAIKKKYQKGTKIKLIHMEDPYKHPADGSIGTVDHVDDAGSIHMTWECGSSLAILPDVDKFEVIE